MLKTLRNKKGVTLVELLAVIVILGIIAAIAVPTIGGLIERQRENAAAAEWDNIKEAARLYIVDESLAQGAAFSVDDLVTEGYLSAEPALTDQDDADATADDLLVVGANNTVTISLVGGDTGLQIDGYTVYPE